jgi:hypothetical protein
VQALAPLGDEEHDEAWYAFSFRLPANFPTINSWATITEISGSHVTHAAYGMLPFDVSGGRFHVIFHTGLTPNPGSANLDPAYNKKEVLLGPDGPRPLTRGVWHDIYFHVIWKARTNGTFELWHRPEGSTWAKLYSNVPNSDALVQRNPHPTMMYNTQYGAPGDGETAALSVVNIGLYRAAPGPTVDFWYDGLRRRQSEAAILAEFPG